MGNVVANWLPKFVGFEGDSIMALDPGIPSRTSTSLGTSVKTKILAVSGSQMSDLTNRAAGYNATYFNAGRIKNLLCILDGHNDLNSGAKTASQFVSDLKTYCQLMAAATLGLKIVICTLLPSNVTGGFNATRNSVNTLIRGDTSFYHALADFDPTSMGADSAPPDTSLYSDGTHPTSAGLDILAPVVTSAIQTVL